MSKRHPQKSLHQRANSVVTLKYTVLIHPGENGEGSFWVEVPALPGCYTQGKTVEQCMERAREAIEGYLESLAKLGEPIPEEPEREDAVIGKVQVRLRVPA
ncbi:MAG: type II toxin-antitoxin system HicB family antitoxin [Tepidisphaeraceae bacterium]|jgi:predicted RNase H-like HicB family nuclease